MAEVLDCNPLALMEVTGQNAEELMMLLLWLEEEHPGMIHVFQMRPIMQNYHNNTDDQDDRNVYYHNGDNWPAHAPCGLWIDNQLLNSFIEEWLFHQQELKDELITKAEYFEWKIGWPFTCDECGKHEPVRKWRKDK